MGFRRKITKTWVHTIDMIMTVDVAFDHLAKAMFVSFLHSKVLLFSLFLLCSLERSHCAAHS